MAPTIQLPPALRLISSILTYAPIPLFAESLRVQTTLAMAILSDNSFNASLTGCVRDLHKLWDMCEETIFSGTENGQVRSVVSLRHGNEFRLANPAIFDTYRITSKRRLPNYEENTIRKTIVGLTFVLPHAKKSSPSFTMDLTMYMSYLASLLEILIFLGLSTYLASLKMVVGSILMACLFMTSSILSTLRFKTNPIFAHAHARASDVERSAKGGAALDVHVIAAHWNASDLNVLCGYSSHLSSLTNIPVRIKGRAYLRVACPTLALVLLLQAAALASMFGKNGTEVTLDVWSPAIWLFVYIIMLAPNSLILKYYPESQQNSLPGLFLQAPPLVFASRRAAIAFISTLPVSERTGRWAWTDIFMPDNSRRKEWQDQLDKYPTPKAMENYLSDPDAPEVSPSLRKIMNEIAITYSQPTLNSMLAQYINAVSTPIGRLV